MQFPAPCPWYFWAKEESQAVKRNGFPGPDACCNWVPSLGVSYLVQYLWVGQSPWRQSGFSELSVVAGPLSWVPCAIYRSHGRELKPWWWGRSWQGPNQYSLLVTLIPLAAKIGLSDVARYTLQSRQGISLLGPSSCLVGDLDYRPSVTFFFWENMLEPCHCAVPSILESLTSLSSCHHLTEPLAPFPGFMAV